MNYRHAYHAGNHADVLKHAVLVRILEQLKAKASPFAVLDAHAGIGVYDLSGIEAGKTFEWHGGIGRLAETLAGEAGAMLRPYLAAVAAEQTQRFGADLRYYPGSPALACRLSRPQDRLYFNELHPVDHQILQERFASRKSVKVFALDAVAAVKSILPFATGRGLVLIDPPFEKEDEVERTSAILQAGLRRMPHAIYAIWYPLKADKTGSRIKDAVLALLKSDVLRAEILVRTMRHDGGLAGSGVIVVNPPWKLKEELDILVPALAERLADGEGWCGSVDWLAAPK
jgi:23S rRNA (adenine2030-N6)-methyltransferase